MTDPAEETTQRTIPCSADPERMFPVDESGPGQALTVGERVALAVCAHCPVRAAVLAMPLPYGVAGGLTAAQRRQLRATRLGRAERRRRGRVA